MRLRADELFRSIICNNIRASTKLGIRLQSIQSYGKIKLMMRWGNNANKGFTIVELLIVVVVIAILAAITIVAFNGIQQQARNSAVQSVVSQVAKKIQLHAVQNNNSYPLNFSDLAINQEPDTEYVYTLIY